MRFMVGLTVKSRKSYSQIKKMLRNLDFLAGRNANSGIAPNLRFYQAIISNTSYPLMIKSNALISNLI